MSYSPRCASCGQPSEPRSNWCLTCELAGQTLHSATSAFLGTALRDWLDATLETQSNLARSLDVDASIVHLWVQNRRAVPAYRLSRLARVMDTSVVDLVALQDVVPGNPRYVVPPEPERRFRWVPPESEPEREVRRDTQALERIEAYSLYPLSGPSPVPGRPRRCA